MLNGTGLASTRTNKQPQCPYTDVCDNHDTALLVF
jgi:hypothetical protein